MARGFKPTIYVDRDPDDQYKGWGWIELAIDDCRKFGIDTGYPETYKNKLPGEGYKYANSGNLPSRGRTGGKRFRVNINDEIIELKSQKSLTIRAICSWLQKWAPPDTKLISASGRVYSLTSNKADNTSYFVYFIFNKDSNAIKIGLAKDIEKRLETLQTSSPVKLELLKSIQVKGKREAQELENNLHKKFADLRLMGEWFSFDSVLREYLDEPC